MQMFVSMMMSYLGVASPERRKRDFERGNAKAFIGIGLLMLLLFILSVVTVVKLVLSN